MINRETSSDGTTIEERFVYNWRTVVSVNQNSERCDTRTTEIKANGGRAHLPEAGRFSFKLLNEYWCHRVGQRRYEWLRFDLEIVFRKSALAGRIVGLQSHMAMAIFIDIDNRISISNDQWFFRRARDSIPLAKKSFFAEENENGRFCCPTIDISCQKKWWASSIGCANQNSLAARRNEWTKSSLPSVVFKHPNDIETLRMFKGARCRTKFHLNPDILICSRSPTRMGIHNLGKLIADQAPGAIKEGEMNNYFGRKIAIDA